MTILESLITFAAIACAWIGGYALMWVGKWTVATLVLHENIYLDAIQQIILRTNDEVKNLELTYSMVLGKKSGIAAAFTLCSFILYPVNNENSFNRRFTDSRSTVIHSENTDNGLFRMCPLSLDSCFTESFIYALIFIRIVF